MADDGSSDGSFELMAELTGSDSRFVLVRLARNFGHQIALSAALDFTTGDVVVLMDGDLQDIPEAIPMFVAKYQEGYDVVYARRERRKEPLPLRISYYIFYRLLTRLSRIALPLDAGDFGLLSRRVVDELRRAPERHRYLRGLRAWVGFRQIGIPVERAARAAGRSKYSVRRLVGLAFDAMFSFSVVPLRAAAVVGFVAIVLSSGFALYSALARLLFGRVPPGFASLMVMLAFLSGVNLLFLGLLGEYVGRIYEEVKHRPLYVVERVVRSGSGPPSTG
jgi:dolichol-phosphate mannosyltransferase